MDKLLKGSLSLALFGAILLLVSSPQTTLSTLNTFIQHAAKSSAVHFLSQGFISQSYDYKLISFHDYYGYMPHILSFIH